MIPILYPSTETEFDTNGIGLLSDATDCTVNQVLNGEYELTMKYPVTGIHFSGLAMRRIILATPDPVSDAQPFRIYRITKPLKGIVTVYARHMAYDLMGITVPPFSADTANDAMQKLGKNALTDCPFSFWTDKSTSATMTVAVPSSIWGQLGGTEGSLLDVYGGEYEFDRLTVKLLTRRGADRGVSIRYGKNLTDLEQDENCANCYTGVYPYWADLDGNLVTLPERIVAAEGDFDYVKIYPLDLSAEWEEAPTEDALRARAEKYITDNDIGTPKVSWEVKFVQLEQTEEYRGQALLERVLLGDTVAVEFSELGISASARAVQIQYKPLLNRYDSVTLGSVKSSLADTIVSQSKEIEKKTDVSLSQQISESIAKAFFGANGGAVRLLDTNGDGMPDTLYVADNADPDLAVKVWRWNYLGWAASASGYNGEFTLGATLEDGILANAVTAANLTAGTIQSADGETFYLDLDNGILRIKSVSEIQSGAIASQEVYYALGDSPDEPPSAPTIDGDTSNALVGLAAVGVAEVGNTDLGVVGWTTEQPDPVDGGYIWMVTLLTYLDGSTAWTTPTLLTDDYTRAKIASVESSFEQTASEIKASVSALETTSDSTSSTLAALTVALGELQTYVDTTITSADESIRQELSSLISQTAAQVEATFTQVNSRIDTVDGDLTEAIEELKTYIRLSGDGVEIGKSDSDYTALLSNDRLEFRESGTVVAYISNNKMHITALEVTESARLTCFEFRQRSNGHGIIRYKALS